MIVLMAGLPGTGKTTLARELAARTSGRVLSKDEIRHALFTPDEIEYSSRQDDFCLRVMLQTAGYLLEAESQSDYLSRRATVFAPLSDRDVVNAAAPCVRAGASSSASARKKSADSTWRINRSRARIRQEIATSGFIWK
jgi:predicted kinase